MIIRDSDLIIEFFIFMFVLNISIFILFKIHEFIIKRKKREKWLLRLKEENPEFYEKYIEEAENED